MSTTLSPTGTLPIAVIFAPDGYRRVLGARGMALVDVRQDAGNNTCYLATKSR